MTLMCKKGASHARYTCGKRKSLDGKLYFSITHLCGIYSTNICFLVNNYFRCKPTYNTDEQLSTWFWSHTLTHCLGCFACYNFVLFWSGYIRDFQYVTVIDEPRSCWIDVVIKWPVVAHSQTMTAGNSSRTTRTRKCNASPIFRVSSYLYKLDSRTTCRSKINSNNPF